jgi:hypothetical protein
MYLYLTTTGRVTGQPREIEIWFTERGGHRDNKRTWIRRRRRSVVVAGGLADPGDASG